MSPFPSAFNLSQHQGLFIFILLFFYFTILYWFCHTSTCIHHGCTRVPHPESPSHIPPHTIPLGHPSAPAPSFLYPALNLDWRFVSYESALLIRWATYWSFSFNISPCNEHPGLISFRTDWLDLLSPRDSQESSPTPQFKSINSSALSFLYTPILTSIHDYWKNHSFD